MKIKPTYVTFEQAKLLKEKGFDVECNHYYEYSLKSRIDQQDGYSGPFGWEKGELNYQSGYFINNIEGVDTSNESWYLCARPEQWQVVEWLRINHGIEVETYKSNYNRYDYRIINGKESLMYLKLPLHRSFHPKQEAYSAAFDYILKELI